MHTYIYYIIYEYISYTYHSTAYHIRRTYLHHRFIGGKNGVLSRGSTGAAVGGPGFTEETSRVGRFLGEAQKGSNWGNNLPSGKLSHNYGKSPCY